MGRITTNAVRGEEQNRSALRVSDRGASGCRRGTILCCRERERERERRERERREREREGGWCLSH